MKSSAMAQRRHRRPHAMAGQLQNCVRVCRFLKPSAAFPTLKGFGCMEDLKYENSVVVPWQLDQGQCLYRYFPLDWSCTWPGCFVELGAAKNPSHLCPWLLTLSQSWKQIADLAKLAPSMWKMLGIVFELQVKGYPENYSGCEHVWPAYTSNWSGIRWHAKSSGQGRGSDWSRKRH